MLIDEVHERGVDTDFLMCVLRDLLKTEKSFKIVLMSATLNAKKFSEYFDSCPIIEIPGRTFPVTEHYLEDVLRLLDRDDGENVKSEIDYEAITSLTVHITRTTQAGAILIFMPGVGEISKLVTMIQRRVHDSAWVSQSVLLNQKPSHHFTFSHYIVFRSSTGTSAARFTRIE